jgi:hypothetical protein
VRQRHPHVAVELGERLVQALRARLGGAHERLHLRLAERGRAPAGEPAAESLDPGHAQPSAVTVHDRAGALQHGDPGVGQDPDHAVRLVAVVVVVSQHGQYRYRQVAELARHALGLGGRTVAGEVAREEQDVRLLARLASAGR